MKKRMVTVIVLLAMGTAVFAMGTKQAMTEGEGLALVDQKAVELALSVGDADSAEDAYMALIEAKVQVRNALKIVSDALDEGLRHKEMTELAAQTRARIKQGLSARQCEDAAKLMLQEQIRLRTRDGELKGETKQTEAEGEPASTGKK